MGVISLSQEIIQRLEAIAQRENRSPEDVVASLLEHYTPLRTSDEDEIIPGTLAELARAAQRANLRSGISDTSERSREILNTEFADYLLQRMQEQD